MRLAAGMLLLAVALAGVGCGESTPSTPDGGPPALSFAASTVVFPDTVIDRVAENGVKPISVTNVADEPFTPTFALTSEADFTIESTTCTTLEPGASCEVVVRFEPHTLGARIVDLIAAIDGLSVTATLVGSALAEPGLSSPTSAMHYDDVAVGAAKVISVFVNNGSTVAARPYAVAVVGPNVGDFAILADGCSGVSKPPNTTCAIDVRFTPSALSSRSAQLVVSSANLGSLIIALDGNGYLPAELGVSPGNGMFGSVFELDNSLAQPFTVTNSGTVPSPALSVSLSGTNSSFFALTDGCSGSPLAAGASCMFSIVYRPLSAGMHTAAATVSAGSLTPVVVPLTGSGEPAQIRINESGWFFGKVPVGQTSYEKTITVENIGSTNTGGLAVAFQVPTSTFALLNDECTGTDLVPGATCTVGMTATPSARGWSSVSIEVSATRGDEAVGYFHVEGIIPAMLAPTTAAFGDVQMTESPSVGVTVMNVGDMATGTIAVAIVGVDAADVSLVDNCTGDSLTSLYDSCSLMVTFTPSHLGAVTASIEITSAGANLSIPVTANTLPAPTFAVSPDSVVLNPVVVGESYPQTFVVQGTGATTGPLTVAITGSNAADYSVTNDDCSGQSIASDQACTVTVTLTPSGTGSRNAVLVVAGEPGGYRKIPLTGIAFTQAKLTISNSSVMFASTGIGQTDTFGFLIIKNTGERPTGTLTAQLTGADPTEFGVIADKCTGIVLAPDAECSVHTQFAPTKIATSTANLVVSATPGGIVSTALSGTGLPPPVISSTITSYDFPAQETFTEPRTQIKIDNIGGSPTDKLHASLSGPQAAAFTADDYGCYSVAAGAYCSVYVTFHPTEVGQASATLVVESPLAGKVTIALTGTATPGVKVVASPDSWDFGFTTLGQDGAAKTFVATNIGQRDVTMFGTFIDSPYFCENFTVVSTTCGSTLAPNASCQTEVLHHPVSSPYPYCRLVFVENTLVIGESALLGQTGP